MEFLRIPLETIAPEDRQRILREGRQSPLFLAILLEMQDHAAGSLATAAGQAADGTANAYQLGAGTGVCDLGWTLHSAAHAAEAFAEAENGEGSENP